MGLKALGLVCEAKQRPEQLDLSFEVCDALLVLRIAALLHIVKAQIKRTQISEQAQLIYLCCRRWG